MKSCKKPRDWVMIGSCSGVVLRLLNIQLDSGILFWAVRLKENTKLVTNAEDANGSPSTASLKVTKFRES